MNLVDEFTTLAAALQRVGVDFAVCGGVALALHGVPRFTNDIDLLVLTKDLGQVIASAERCGFVLEEGLIPVGTQGGNPVEIRRLTKISGEDHLLLDLVPVVPVLESVWNGKRRYEWQGMSIPVVSAAGLAKMKRLAGRPQDLADINALGFSIDDPAIQP